jgi:nucleoredoxin
MLAEMYEHLKEARTAHGLEIVFVSSDRDQSSFQQYFSTMPWQAIPFDNLQFVKQSLSMT